MNEQFGPPIAIRDLPESEQLLIMESLKNPTACHLCGCTGFHACIGYPVIWTQADKDRLNAALSKMYGWDKKDNE